MQNNKRVIAKIGKTIGLQGELKLHLYDLDFAQLQNFQPLFLCKPNSSTWITLEPEAFVLAKKRIRFRDHSHITSASALVHGLLAITKEQLPLLPADTFYYQDLIGKTVMNPDGELFGSVTAIINNGAHDVLVCLDHKTEHFIPFIQAYVVKVEVETITVLWSIEYSL